MGVRGLWEIVQSTARPVKVETLGGNRLAVDASIWIYQFLKTTRGGGKKNAHLVGFFRRILKLLFLGIKPVFVFDGVAPELKRKTVARRRERREGRIDSMEREAKRILAMQLEQLEQQQSGQKRKQKDDDDDNDSDNVKGSELLGGSSSGAKKQRKTLKSDYDLPELDVNVGQDDRFLTQKELQERQQLENLMPQVTGDGSIDIKADIDFDSDHFRSLPDATQYELLNKARLRSRLRMGHTADQLQQLFPNDLQFSRFQVERVALRNNYTQRLMQLAGMGADLTIAKENETEPGINRVSSEKGTRYMMERNDEGWTLALHADNGQRSSPVLVDEDEEEETRDKRIKRERAAAEARVKEESESEEDWEDVDIDAEVKERYQDALKDEDVELQQSILDSLDEKKKTELQFMTQQLKMDQFEGMQSMDWGGGIFSAPAESSEDKVEPQVTLRDQGVWKGEEGDSAVVELSDEEKEGKGKEAEDEAEDKAEVEVGIDTASETAGSDVSESEKNDKEKDKDVLPLWFQQPLQTAQKQKDEESSDSDEEAGLYYGNRTQYTKPEVVELSDDDDDVGIQEIRPRSSAPAPAPASAPAPATSPLDKSTSKSATSTTTPTAKSIDNKAPVDNALVVDPTPVPSVPASTSQADESESEAEFESVPIDSQLGPNELPGFDTGIFSGGILSEQPTEPKEASVEVEAPLTEETEVLGTAEDDETNNPDDPDNSFGNMVLAEEEAVEELQTSKNLVKNLSREQDEFEKQFKLEEQEAREMRMALMDELQNVGTQKSRDSTNEEAITQTMIDECQQLLTLFGIPFITAPTEAEAQCATLVNLNLVDGVITEDSDVFLFASNPKMRVFKNFFNSNKYVECYKTGEVAATLNLERKDLIDLALLLGSDYTDGLPGIGPVSAMEILAEFKGPEKDTLREFKEWWERELANRARGSGASKESAFKEKFSKRFLSKLFLGPSFPSEKIRNGYLRPSVDDDDTHFKWGHPSLVGLREYLGETIGGKSIDQLLLPVLQQMNAKQNRQTQILDFLPNGNDSAGSVRIEKALQKIKQRAKEKRGERAS